eukprot:gnl/TRDRNA2_/TRDRNA2_91266_c0_seq1.p1 gnl/TRDRNA2_/TRDRNA2_91266_c0~~gnl/TRDRNA2_/TRDRNA2_91266_c0_seq1.p1  ORF type:complete len:259 (+),score=37.95 gnl/TRDRNA2_/TRDRNA2_91266_c0_seq1:25-801(+)
MDNGAGIEEGLETLLLPRHASGGSNVADGPPQASPAGSLVFVDINKAPSCSANWTIDQLPPAPERDPWAQFEVSCQGVACVLAAIVGELYLLHQLSQTALEQLPFERRALMMLNGSLAIIAVVCVACIPWVDPGVIRRSPETCFPLPDAVSEKLLKGNMVMANVVDGNMSFCVRCFVWRPHGSHHCNECKTCVRDFDHHCDVFGRCIAGDGWFRGNLGIFRVLMSCLLVSVIEFLILLPVGMIRTMLASAEKVQLPAL